MYSSCTSSTIAFRTNKSVPFCSNDYYLLNERLISKIASSSCSPCSCCAFCFYGGVPVNPRVLYGLRQSTLLNFSATRRLIFGTEGRYYRLSVSDFDRNCCGDANFGRESFSGRRRRKGRGKGRRDAEFGFRNWEERSFELSVDGTAETMLGLLTEQVDEKLLLGVRKPSRRFTSVNAHLGDRQTDITNKCCKDEEKNLELNSMETHSDVRVESRGREVSSRHEHGKLRKEGSSCSSYYSVLSSDEIDDSDMDTQVKSIEFIGGSSSRHKNNEMMSTEVVVADNVREDFEKYKGHDAELGETLAYKNAGAEVSADNAVDRDVQNCKEKMFIDMSVGKKESRMESSQRDSSMMESLDTIAGKASASQKRFHARERNSASSSNLVEKIEEKESQSIRKGIQQSAPMRKSRQFTDTTLIQGSNSRTSSSSQIQMSGRKENVSATQKVVQEARAKHDHRDQYIIRENKASLKSQSETKKLAHGVNLENISHSQTISKSGLNDTVENSAFSQTSVHDSREQHTITDQQFIGKTETREELLHLTNISASCSIDTKKLIESKDFYEMRLDTQKEKSISTMGLTQEAQGRSSEQVVRKVGLDNSKRPSELSSSWESSKEECSSSQKPARQQQLAAQTEGGRNSQAVVLPPPSQFVVKPSQETIGYQKTGRRLAQENASLEFSGSESIGIQTEDERLGFLHEHDGQIRRDEIYGDHLHNDALDSANRLEESSKQFIGEFAEKLQHVVRTSEVEEEKTSSGKVSPYRNGKYTQEGLNQKMSEDFQLQLQFPGESSAVSGTKGPSDEMWDVADPILQERSEEHAEVNPGTEIAIMKRSSRSLWSLVGDIVRMRWHTRSETNSMAMKSAERTSSNESVASDTWFSSHEVDDKIDDNVKKGKRRVQKDDRPKCQSHPGEVSSQSRGKVTNESDMSSSLGTAETGSPFEAGASLASQEGNFGDKQEIMNREGLHSTILTADSSLPVHSRRMMRSPPVRDEISESSKVVVSGGFTEAVEQPIPDRLIDTSASEPKDGELKRRKLQRSKQVLTERFEEWEEAYRLESEQRKMDEMFMREALLEARKAADTWEVPVGAVLVQHGKIIARGCNMVEELRDSTAHAEMICIREASNLLRSWRLPDTTLYVTLEPCAMCAGAILQARIDTVVWGAPNKLLGADGSWVRLFPGGLEGNTSDHTDQAAGPVHPFHPKMAIRRGVLATECSEAMQQFFQLRRKKKKADSPPPSCLPVSAHPSKLFTKIHDIFSIMFCL